MYRSSASRRRNYGSCARQAWRRSVCRAVVGLIFTRRVDPATKILVPINRLSPTALRRSFRRRAENRSASKRAVTRRAHAACMAVH